ncbi:hypothetical protein Cgig2_030493 [Carnegiea gigantea]|uniref:DUF4283 domain-containing protein n=1 Tax=Carnegiea gigantea TaxID=171969 RepID=A0A9Q1JJU6_9CARY|nr:hypothetical protein Cgig2_030493 [Carnegiea gigantea]
MIDSNKGTELNFIPTQIINGIKCTRLEKSNAKAEIQYWENAVICTVLGANPPFEVMKGFLKRIWANHELDKILYVRKGVFLVRLVNLQDKLAVQKRGFYFFDKKPLFVKGWTPTMDLQMEAIKSLPLWIQLPALDIKYWGIESLSKIGSLLGIPSKTDKVTRGKQVLRYARLLVEMPIEGPFPEYIEFFNDDDLLIRQQVTYEWVPTKCAHCAMLDHTEEVCKKKGALATQQHFHITFVYGRNQEHQRKPLWEELHQISLSISGAWCILGDFNSVLFKEDRYGHNEVEDHDIPELTHFMADCEVLEMPSSSEYFYWTNKTIWSRIDRVFINSLWHEVFDYTIAKYLPYGLSDHTPILIRFPASPRPTL